jgi:drug/metabolite transporter (DMT)-like permease
VARTTKKRRRKHRGTQGGGIDRRGRASRPRTREEARARARSAKKQTGKRGQRRGRNETPPSWTGAIGRAAFGGAVFFLLLMLLFQRGVGPSLLLAGLMTLFYIPLGHAVDQFMYRRRMRAKQREYEKRKAAE